MKLLGSFSFSDQVDRWVWDLSEDGEFSVAETRRWIDNIVLPTGLLPTRCCGLVPRKVNIFVWRILLDRIPSYVALSARGIELNSILYPICGKAPEVLQHLFGRCDVAVSIWEAVTRWLQIPSFAFLTPSEIFDRVDGGRCEPEETRRGRGVYGVLDYLAVHE
ncbi:hypothetical protein LXL04_033642 [Taraxacum kok-saghyz]